MKYQITINQHIANDSADEWVEIYNTYAEAEKRVFELQKKNEQYDPNYSIVVLNGIEAIQ
jgi:hypothetical protein